MKTSEDDKEIIYHSKKLLLFDSESTMRRGLTDVAMWTYYDFEECKVVRTFLLKKSSKLKSKN